MFDTQIQIEEVFCHIFAFNSEEEYEEFEKALQEE